MGKRALLALSSLILLFTLGATAAQAQYAPPTTSPGGGPPTSVPGNPPAGCPPQNPPTDAPCHPRARANVSDDNVAPGETVTVSTENGTFEGGSDLDIRLSRVRRGSPTFDLGTDVADADGGMSQDVVIPQVPNGVYVIWVHGVDENGDPVTALVPIVIKGPNTDAPGATASKAGPPPVAVLGVQTVSPAAETAAIAAVANGAALSVANGSLEVVGGNAKPKVAAAGLSTTGADLAAPVTVGGALLLTGAGLLVLRNRRRATAK